MPNLRLSVTAMGGRNWHYTASFGRLWDYKVSVRYPFNSFS